MTPHEYLTQLLRRQDLTEAQLRQFRDTREQIEGWLRGRYGSVPRFYYAGSYGKGTMIAEAYDLDLVMYFPSTERRSLGELYWDVHRRLADGGYQIVPRTVALRLPYNGAFHVDVVPGRAQDHTFRYATLYRNATPSGSLQTSLKVHIEAVKDAGLSDTVRLMKLWKLRHRLSISTFAIEIVVWRAMRGVRRDNLASAMLTTFNWIVNNLSDARLEDPANTNNVIEVSWAERTTVVAAARNAVAAANWSQIVW